MNTDFILGIIGLCGGILCAAADILLDFKGKGNKKYGPAGILDTNWEKMAPWRFKASIWVAAIAVPMYMMGCIALYNQLLKGSAVVAGVFGICAVIGSCGTMFIHTTLCYFPIMTKTLSAEKTPPETVSNAVNALYRAMIVPFLTFWLLLVVGLSGIVIYAIWANVLLLPWGFVMLTPLSLVLAGLILWMINRDIFGELPAICMPSVGLGMLGLMAALNTLSL
ncbi:MAG: hypothetical protein LBL96_05365 [Clostridiales bacterium]|jgi:hypothetical protein|nr:hypothetical protein [Clostridiales bacterium]